MDVRDFPCLDDPTRLIGRAAYRLTEDEFVSTIRASRIALLPWRRSWPWAIAFYGFWYATALFGIYYFGLPLAMFLSGCY